MDTVSGFKSAIHMNALWRWVFEIDACFQIIKEIIVSAIIIIVLRSS